jgi:tRNA A37 N6-isopentenylltransferase MiaA
MHMHAVLEKRIQTRVDSMVTQGLVKEARLAALVLLI